MILVAMPVAAAVALLVERLAYRPLRNSPRLVLLISAIGASFFLQYTCEGSCGLGIFAYPTVPFLAEPVDLPILTALRLNWIDVVVIGSAIVMMVGALPVRDAHQGWHRHPRGLGGQGHRRAHGHRRQPRHRDDVRASAPPWPAPQASCSA